MELDMWAEKFRPNVCDDKNINRKKIGSSHPQRRTKINMMHKNQDSQNKNPQLRKFDIFRRLAQKTKIIASV